MDKLKVEESDWTLFEIPLESRLSEKGREILFYQILLFCKNPTVHADKYRIYSYLDGLVDGISLYFRDYKKHSGLCVMVWAYSGQEAKDRAVKFCENFNKWQKYKKEESERSE